MATNGGSARSRRAEVAPRTSTLRQIAWLGAAGGWTFVLVSLLSFSPSDWPSHTVAVHADPSLNLCGRTGALIAYWGYQVLGLGAWIILAGLGGALGVTVTGRSVTHPLLRAIGLLIMATAGAALHGLFLPGVGPLPGVPSGLVGHAIAGEFAPRFNVFGSALLLLASFAVGAIVAIDSLVLALPRAAWQGLRCLRAIPGPVIRFARHLLSRPRATPALAGGAHALPGETAQRPARRRTSRAAEAEVEFEQEESEKPEALDALEDTNNEEEDESDEAAPELEDGAATEEEVDEESDDQGADAAARPQLSEEELRAKIAKLPLRIASRDVKLARDEDIPRTQDFRDYSFPTLDLLQDPESNFNEKMEAAVREQAQQLEQALRTFGIDGEVVGIESGPTVTLYSVELVAGTKVAKVSAVASDIARSLAVQNIRIVANMVGRTAIGIEVPNRHRERVRLKELMTGGKAEGMVLPMFLGKDSSGEPLVADLTRMPHMLIAGTTGSGKSVCMNTILMSWLYTKRPDELKLVLVDPKMVEMSQFQDIPHLMCPVVTESTKAAAIMEWAVERMEERYELLREARVQNIVAYNRMTEEELYDAFGATTDEERARIQKKLPYMVFVVDELADLMMTCREVEHAIVRIAQKARAVGIHLVLATQRPQANVVTGLIKANMPCRISFKVASGMDSRIVLDQKGAELLLGQGDMLFISPQSTEAVRSQGTLVEDGEIKKVVKFLRTVAAPSFERALVSLRTLQNDEATLDASERDPMFEEAVHVLIETGRGSVSLLQRRLGIGYGRASRLVDQMGMAGILGEHKGSVAREVLITAEEWDRMKKMEEAVEVAGTVFEKPEATDADDDELA